MYRCQSCGEPQQHAIDACRLCGQQVVPPTRRVILGPTDRDGGDLAGTDADTSSTTDGSTGGRVPLAGGIDGNASAGAPNPPGSGSSTPLPHGHSAPSGSSGIMPGTSRSSGLSMPARVSGSSGGFSPSKPSGQGPFRWEGRTVLPPDVAYVASRRSSLIVSLLLVWVVYVLVYSISCPDDFGSIIGTIVFVVILFVITVSAIRWLSPPFASVLGGAGRMAAGGVMGAAMASRGGLGAVPVLMARIDAGLPNDVTIKIVRAAEGVRQGDHLEVWGPRVLGTVRSVFVRNITAGRLFWNLRAVKLPLLLIATLPLLLIFRITSTAC